MLIGVFQIVTQQIIWLPLLGHMSLLAPTHRIRALWLQAMETNASNIPETGTATFNGAGRGLHKEFSDTYTKFGVTAAVNFSARTVGLTS